MTCAVPIRIGAVGLADAEGALGPVDCGTCPLDASACTLDPMNADAPSDAREIVVPDTVDIAPDVSVCDPTIHVPEPAVPIVRGTFGALDWRICTLEPTSADAPFEAMETRVPDTVATAPGVSVCPPMT